MRDFTFIAEHVTKTLHGKNTGPWSLSFKVFRDNNQNNRQIALKDSKLLYQVSLAQQPGHVYCMVDGSVVVEAEKEMEIILSRLKNLWQLRQSVTIEVNENVDCARYSVCMWDLMYANRVQVTKLAILHWELPIFCWDLHTKDCC